MALITGLVGAWEMDEASGQAIDSHGSNPLTDVNTVGSNGTGWRDFEADNVESFSHVDNADLSTGDIDFTAAVEVQLESKSNDRTIAMKWDGSGTEWILWFDNAGNFGTADRFGFLIRNTIGVVTAAQGNNLGSPALGTPYHIVARVNHVTKGISITINNGTPNTNTYSGTIADTASAFNVGSDGSGSTLWDGLMRRLRFWKRLLTDDEVTQLYNGGAGMSYADIVAESSAVRRFLLVR
jgi:hypothetical protein